MQIIIFQKFIHHLPATCLWSMLVSSLIPLRYDLPKKLLKKYIETSFSYIRILEFGESFENGNIKKKHKPSLAISGMTPSEDISNNKAPMAYTQNMINGAGGATPGRIMVDNDGYQDEYKSNQKDTIFR